MKYFAAFSSVPLQALLHKRDFFQIPARIYLEPGMDLVKIFRIFPPPKSQQIFSPYPFGNVLYSVKILDIFLASIPVFMLR